MGQRDFTTALIFWIIGLFGICGLHRLYTGRTWTGILWLLTGGLCFVGQIVDIFFLSDHCEEPLR